MAPAIHPFSASMRSGGSSRVGACVAFIIAFSCMHAALAQYNVPMRTPGDAATCPPIDQGLGGNGTMFQDQYFVLKTLASGREVLQVSSNMTLTPFHGLPVPIEQLQAPLRTPTERTCDKWGRCIEAYEVVAQIQTADVGFRDENGVPVLTQFLSYDGTVPGPRFEVEQGTQTLVRVHNRIHCNLDNSVANMSDSFYGRVTGISVHLHGSPNLSPFDGWAADIIRPCQWKDYVFPNVRPNAPIWVHDHALGITAFTASSGLFAPYFVKACNPSSTPASIRKIAQVPQYLSINDALFIQAQGSDYMNPYLDPDRIITTVPGYTGPALGLGASVGDHILVNGRPWPTVSVKRQAYWFVLHNAAQIRSFNLTLRNDTSGSDLNQEPGAFWVVGGDGGLNNTPVEAPEGVFITPGERYMVIIDFSAASQGSTFTMYNSPVPWTISETPSFCYTHLIMRFVVEEDLPRDTPEPFDPQYEVDPTVVTDVSYGDMLDACKLADEGNADFQFSMTQRSENGSNYLTFTSKPGTAANSQWTAIMQGRDGVLALHGFNNGMRRRRSLSSSSSTQDSVQHSRMQGDTNSIRSGRGNRKLAQGFVGKVDAFVPFSVPTNGWITMSVYNDGTRGAHPLHVHLIDFFICNRINNMTRANGLRPYEFLSPKDEFFVGIYDTVTAVARFGPTQGSYMFHCHNLVHEDQGLMGAINSTSAPGHRGRGSDPGIPDPVTFVDPAVLDSKRFDGYDSAPHSLPSFEGPDPLVSDQDANPDIGHNLYAPQTMPAWAMRHDPDHPGWPQRITTSLLKAVLDRNYYRAFYPGGRKLWQKPSSGNPYAIQCPKPADATSSTPTPTPSPAGNPSPSPSPSSNGGQTPVAPVLPLTGTACARGGPSNLTMDALVGRWTGTCRTLGYNTGPDFALCVPPGSTLEYRLDAEFFANASSLQWEHATSVVLPNGTVIVRPEQQFPPGQLDVTLTPLPDNTSAISACASVDFASSQQKVVYRMACDIGSISGVPQQTMTIQTSLGAGPDGSSAYLDACADHDPTHGMGEANSLYCTQASTSMSALYNAVCTLTRVDFGFEWPWL